MDILTSKVGMDNVEIDMWVLIPIVAICYFLIARLSSASKNLPPGPTGLPLVGYVPFLTSEPHKKLKKLADKFGNIFGYYMGRAYVVILSDPDMIREVFNKEVNNGRPENSSISPPNFRKSISSLNGQHWAEQRKFVFHTVRGLGKGNEYVDDLMKEEIRFLLERLKKSKGKPTDINDLLTRNITNLITQLAFSKRYDYDDDDGIFLGKTLQYIIEFADQTALHSYYPWLAFVPIVNRFLGIQGFPPVYKKLRIYFEKLVKEHEKTFDPNNLRDYIDSFLMTIKNDEKKNIKTSFTRETLIGTMFVLFAAGGETVRTSLDWTYYIIASKPEVQRKIQEEIEEVVGSERNPDVTDKDSMPYTLSVIMEVQRYITIIPVNVFHQTMEDATIDKYHIPRGTYILSNLWAIHRDPKYWDRPEEFVAERFLEKSGTKVIKPKSYLPFSVGKRICPGEQLAIDEIFLYLTSVMQKFHLKLPEGEEVVENFISISNQLKQHKICHVLRE